MGSAAEHNYGNIDPGSSGADGLQGGAEDYLHEAPEANTPASGTFYNPAHTGVRLATTLPGGYSLSLKMCSVPS